MTFPDIPAGGSVFIDSNTFVYHLGPQPVFQPACQQSWARRDKLDANASVLTAGGLHAGNKRSAKS